MQCHLVVDHVTRVMKKKSSHWSFAEDTNINTAKQPPHPRAKTFYQKT